MPSFDIVEILPYVLLILDAYFMSPFDSGEVLPLRQETDLSRQMAHSGICHGATVGSQTGQAPRTGRGGGLPTVTPGQQKWTTSVTFRSLIQRYTQWT